MVRIMCLWVIFDNSWRSFKGINDSSRPKSSCQTAQDRDFDEDANDLWTLYGKQAEGHDEGWIKVLKEDMDSVLIFVCSSFFCSASVDVNLIPGWFILGCSHCVRHPQDSGFESELRRPVSLLPESNSLYDWPNIATTRLSGSPDFIRLYTLPDLSSVDT